MSDPAFHPGIGFRTLLYRECHRFLRLANQTLIPPFIMSALYIVIFGFSIGSRIDARTLGVTYLQFIVPGLVMMNVISGAYANTSGSVYIARFQGNIQELLVAPLSTLEIVGAIVLGGVARGLCVGIGLTAVCAWLAGLTVAHVGVTLYFMTLVSLIFSCAGFLSGLWAEDFDRLSLFQTYVLTPLTYLGGVFFAVDMLPPFWRSVAALNPVLYFVNGLRYGFLGFADVGLGLAAVSAAVVGALLFGACYALFRAGYNIKT